MKTLNTFESVRQQVADMDMMGFFSCNGTFGLEKRDDLLAAVAELEAERAALVAVAGAAEAHQNAKPGQELKLWANIQKALATLAAVRAGSEVAK